MAKLKRRLLSTSVQSLLITVIVVLVLVLVGSPIAQAITFSYPQGIPGTGILGSTYTFQVQINITDADLLPLTSVDLRIYNAASPSNTLTCTNLPIPATAGGTASDTYSGDFGTVSVSALTGANWVYAFEQSRYGYGYGYPSGPWKTPQSFPGGYGYGYGYNTDYTGPTWIRFIVTWTSPSTWPTGTYNVETVVYGSVALTDPETRSFTLSAPPPGERYRPFGGPGPEAPPFRPSVTGLSDIVDEEGVFTESTSIEIGRVELTIPEGTTGLTEEGEPLSEITVTEMAEPPAPPKDANVIGFPFDLGPDGATFDPPITLTFTIDPADIPAGLTIDDMVIAYYDATASPPGWVELSTSVIPGTNILQASVSHFTAFTILAYIPPVPVPAPPAPPPAPPAPPPAPPVITAPVVPPPAPPVVIAPVVPPPAPPVPVVPAPPVPAPTPWWILVIIAVATIVVVGVVLWFFEFRRV